MVVFPLLGLERKMGYKLEMETRMRGVIGAVIGA